MKQHRPEVKNLHQIDESVMRDYGEYLRDAGYSEKTAQTYMMTINRIQIDEGHFDKPYTPHSLGIKIERKNINNSKSTPEQLEQERKNLEKYPEIYEFGRAFGLRKGELIGNRNPQHTYASNKSLYEDKNGTLYCVSIGKGGKLRKSEVLKEYENGIREKYQKDIQSLPDYLYRDDNRFTKEDKESFLKDCEGAERYFPTINRSTRVQVECRQYYVENKLREIQDEGRFDEGRTIRINGVEMTENEAKFISEQLGHHRLEILKKYVGRQETFA